MGYTVELNDSRLRCRSQADAIAAAAIIRRHEDLASERLQVYPRCMSHPARDDAWSLEIDSFTGDHWDENVAQALWLALAPHLAEDATIEFQSEDRCRWRIRWSASGVVEEYVEEVIWAVGRQLQPPLKGTAP